MTRAATHRAAHAAASPWADFAPLLARVLLKKKWLVGDALNESSLLLFVSPPSPAVPRGDPLPGAAGLQRHESVLEAATNHRGSAFIEIYQNCPIFNDDAFASVKDAGIRDDVLLRLAAGEPLVYGRDLQNGVRFAADGCAEVCAGNDAAVVLARQLGGIEETRAAMNAHAVALGARSTHVATVNGLDGPGMMSTAYDMSLIFRDAMARPAFAEIVATPSTGFPGYPAGPGTEPPDPAAVPEHTGPTMGADGVLINPGFVLGNDNLLLHNYPGAIGGKTGFTDDARHTFIGAAERDGRRLAVVLLDGTRVPSPPWQQAAALLDAGYAAGDSDPVGVLEAGPQDSTDHATEHLAGGLGGAGTPETAIVGGSVLERYSTWLALGAAGLVVVAGAVLTLRSRN